MVKATIKSIDTKAIVATGESYLDVEVLVVDGTTKEVRHLGYPITTSKKEIMADVAKLVETYQLEKLQREQDEVATAQNAQVDTLQDLVGEEVVAPEVTEVTKVAKKQHGKHKK